MTNCTASFQKRSAVLATACEPVVLYSTVIALTCSYKEIYVVGLEFCENKFAQKMPLNSPVQFIFPIHDTFFD